MRTRSVLVIHGETMIAESLTAALAGFPLLAPLRPSTEARAALRHVGRVDAVAIDGRLQGADAVAARLRREGSRVVVIGPAAVDDEDAQLRVATDAPVAVLAEALVPGAVPRPATDLSEQQRRVLELVSRGMTAREVARGLGISAKTVEQHKGRIFRKLGVPNQAAAVRVALGGRGSLS